MGQDCTSNECTETDGGCTCGKQSILYTTVQSLHCISERLACQLYYIQKKKGGGYHEVEGKLSFIKRKHTASPNYRTGSTHFGLRCQTSGDTSSLSFTAKGNLAEKSEGHWLHFPLGRGEGSFHSTLQRGRSNSFKLLHIRPEEQSFLSWNIPSQNIRNRSQGQAYLTSMPFLSQKREGH